MVFAGLLLAAGSLADRVGRKRVFLAGLLAFAAGSAWAAFSGSVGMLIAARAGMGIGAAMMMPATLAIITDMFRDPAERQRAIGIWAGTTGLGIALGPIVGGLLLASFWWRSVFLINVPIAIIGAAGALPLIPDSKNPAARPPDLVGALMSIAYSARRLPPERRFYFRRGWDAATLVTNVRAPAVPPAARALAAVAAPPWPRRLPLGLPCAQPPPVQSQPGESAERQQHEQRCQAGHHDRDADVADDGARVWRGSGDGTGPVDPQRRGASLARSRGGPDVAGPGRSARWLPAGQHPCHLHVGVRIRDPCRLSLLQQHGGDQMIRGPLRLRPAQGLVIGLAAGRGRDHGYHDDEQEDHDQPDGRLDPVRPATQRISIDAESAGAGSQEPGLVNMHRYHLPQAIQVAAKASLTADAGPRAGSFVPEFRPIGLLGGSRARDPIRDLLPYGEGKAGTRFGRRGSSWARRLP